ncbi:N-(5'phosphoribosyl)anthranilate isomerase (PRAI) [Vulcanisaeta moutnovskia 768-28]|uniref:N-(5'-phosphoribosyl)anthranilate isomerase n=1 Tax=Vulcanisaeta moutnovskia (strain 768-28) TaxID=985053 RepID=F0QT35_VULM7|nr:phosphoribosylanthranilate isomerase [Vulcanisaeta moutnovskia]ADY01624.1 N-(5'phosphoribosyl)anthranilate isomerase (PRAI) [Vulcanisaeta moutnovskia 768-28]
MTLLKICGVTSQRDAVMASKYADYVGVIVHSSVPTHRLVDRGRAREIINAVRGVRTVGVVEGLDVASAIKLVGELGFDVVQYHGDTTVIDEAIDLLNQHGIRLALAMAYAGDDFIIEKALDIAPRNYIEYVLIDAPKVGFRTYEHGLKIPLNVIKRVGGIPKVGVAGGINPSNAPIVVSYKPYLVDVSSGVEKSPGVKDKVLVRRIAEVIKGVKY